MEFRFLKCNCSRLDILIANTAFCLLFWIVHTFPDYQKKFDAITERRSERIQDIKNSIIGIKLPENQTPNCIGNLLDQRVHRFIAGNDLVAPFDSSGMMSKNHRSTCRLLHYTAERAVSCLDALHRSRLQLSGKSKIANKLHFVFMGDSRIRQQFYNFLRLIPDHDRRSNPSPIPLIYHGDIEVSSEILRLRVSFKWRPLVDDNVTETLRHWAISDRNEQPDLILFSMALWHIVQIHSTEEYLLYLKRLMELGPILNQLSNFSEIIWLNQYPTAQFYGGMPYGGAYDSDIIVSDKLYHYNEDIRHILEDSGSMRIWDSSNPVAEEYVRACTLIRRGHFGPSPYKDPDHSYIDCNDYIHTGYSALSQATQLLYNYICSNLK